MRINTLTQFKTNKFPAEYTIYAYNKYCADTIGLNKWQCLSVTNNPAEVLEEAQKFFETEKFQKIEIKKKIFDEKNKRHFVSTYREFDYKPKRNIYLMLGATILTIAVATLFFLEII